MTEQYRVEIVDADTGEVVKSLPAHSLRQAEKLENGAMRNLNHAKYFTRIVPTAPTGQDQGAETP